jgi:adenine-specific DNA-methyltransferase
MRYLGGKSRLAPAIYELAQQVAPSSDQILDLFAGSGALGEYFKRQGFQVATNDILYFSFALSRGSLAINRMPAFTSITEYLGQDPRAYLNSSALPRPSRSQTIRLAYSPDSTPPRQYLTVSNALRIDHIRQKIERWNDAGLLTKNEYFYLLSATIAGVPSVSNITGTYGAFLKYWDKRALNDFQLATIDIFSNGKINRSFNMDAAALLRRVSGQVLYLDPPYNERQYLPNYHVLETVALYDRPTVTGVTGQRPLGVERSDFCTKGLALGALESVIEAAEFEHIILSYNNEGVIPTGDLVDLLTSYAAPGSFFLKTIPYRRYKNKIPNHAVGLVEQLYYIRKAGA